MVEKQKEEFNLKELIVIGFFHISMEIVKKLHIVLLIILIIIHRDPEAIKAFGDILVEIFSSSTILVVLIVVIICLILMLIGLLIYFNIVIKNTLNSILEKKKRRT